MSTALQWYSLLDLSAPQFGDLYPKAIGIGGETRANSEQAAHAIFQRIYGHPGAARPTKALSQPAAVQAGQPPPVPL